MTKIPSKHKPILRIILLSIAAIPILFILYIVINILLSPVFNAVDKAKFEQMDSQTREIYNKLQASSGGAEEWKYEAKCEDSTQGGFQTIAEYSCSTTASMEVPAVTSQQLVALHEKYYPIINGLSALRPTSELDKEKPGQFGAQFVVSSAERQYQLVKGGESCDYLAKLAQAYDINHDYSYAYGSAIESGGRLIVSFTCSATANDNWYEFSH